MDEADELRDLIARASRGCPEAARRLHDRYSGPVRRVVRRLLHERLRQQYDSVDFVQSVWASFFALPRDGDFTTPHALVAFLSDVAYKKVAEKTRQRLGTLRYDLNREVPLDEADTDASGEPLLEANTPTPSQHAQADERWLRLLEGLPPGYQLALQMLRDGHSHAEIADRLGVDRKSIRRLLDRLERQLE